MCNSSGSLLSASLLNTVIVSSAAWDHLVTSMAVRLCTVIWNRMHIIVSRRWHGTGRFLVIVCDSVQVITTNYLVSTRISAQPLKETTEFTFNIVIFSGMVTIKARVAIKHYLALTLQTA